MLDFKGMKYISLATLLCGMLSSCTENLNAEVQTEKINTWILKPFMFEGHQYLRYSNGGLIHSESCKCKSKL